MTQFSHGFNHLSNSYDHKRVSEDSSKAEKVEEKGETDVIHGWTLTYFTFTAVVWDEFTKSAVKTFSCT